MKSFKLVAAGMLAASLLASAFAADLGTVRVTGSSAFRTATLNALQGLFKTTGAHPLHYGYVGSSFTGSTYAIFDGELLGGDTVRIATNFTGSAAGIQSIVQTPALSIPFLNTAYGSLATTGTSGLADPSQVPITTAVAHIAMSDVQISLTPFQRATDKTVASPADAPVGVIPFYWVANKNANAAITNITHQMAKALGGGGIPLSFWTGNNADATNVVAVGRDPDSGTRLDAYEEAGYGAASTVTQYRPTPVSTSPTGTTITGLELYPAQTVLGIPFGAGESGYASGGQLNAQFQRTASAGINFVGYLGRTDAAAAVAGGAKLLTYNGVAAPVTGTVAAQNAPFVNGTYSFWSYEQVYFTDDHIGDAVQTVAELLATRIKTVTASTSGIPIDDMKVNRGGEGLVITN